jgi:microcystin degradation protein MlrC
VSDSVDNPPAGAASSLDLTLGGKWDTVNGKSIPLRVTVKAIVCGYGS